MRSSLADPVRTPLPDYADFLASSRNALPKPLHSSVLRLLGPQLFSEPEFLGGLVSLLAFKPRPLSMQSR